jgi:Formamidopyrimidine-DNA glycosylase
LVKVLNLIQKFKDEYICDVLLNQEVFAGVGNIIKNEALFLAKVHPLSIVAKIPQNILLDLVLETRKFSLKFLEIRIKENSLKEYLNIYRRKNCIRCNSKIKIKN